MSRGPLPFIWHDGCLVPTSHYWLARCEERFTEGEKYTLDEWQERSMASHRHYFAAVREAWMNLTENETERFPTPDHLRKFALIKCGYHTERNLVASSRAEARRIAAFMKPSDEYAVVVVKDCVVIEYKAKTQNTKAMDKEEFQKSKDDVLNFLAANIGVERRALTDNAGQAA